MAPEPTPESTSEPAPEPAPESTSEPAPEPALTRRRARAARKSVAVPSRPQVLLTRLAAALVALAGLVTLVLGLQRASAFGSDEALVGRLPRVSEPVVVTAEGMTELAGTTVRVRAVSTASSPVFIGVGRSDDVQAYLGKVARTEVTALDSHEVLRTGRHEGEPSLPDPAGVDVWTASVRTTGVATLTWPRTPGRWRLVIATDGRTSPSAAEFTWSGEKGSSAGPALAAVGAVLLVAGLAVLLVMRSGRRGAGLAAAVLLAGCGAGVRLPPVPGDAGSHTAVAPRQAVMILGAVDAALVRATSAGDVAAAGGRVLGPAREELAATIAVRKALQQAPTPPPAPPNPRLLLTQAEEWPRWFVAAGSSPASATPVIRLLQSPDARSPYGLWAELRMLPGSTLPETAPVTVGSAPLAPGAAGLVRTPAEVMRRYTDLLNRGDASPYQGDFAPDAFRQELHQQLGADRATFRSAGAGEVTDLHRFAPVGPFALPTQDGGALVIGRLDQRYRVAVAPGRTSVRLDPQLAALAARPIITTRLDRWSVEMVAFYVPKAGSSGKVTLIAASRTDVAASGV
jgi:hypothetical protein